MTINSVKEMWSRRSGASRSDDGRSFTQEYLAAYSVTHSADATIAEIQSANDGTTAVPQLGDVYSGTQAIYCVDNGPVEVVGPTYSIVPIRYFGETASNDPTDDPLNKPPEIE